jgi:hypothetical protein
MTRVSRQVRHDTLPMYYGSHSFLFTLFNLKSDGESIIGWLNTIGPVNAGLLRDLKIVYRTKKLIHILQKGILPKMRELGVKDDAVTVKRLPYPYCYCEGCVRKLIGECD